MKFDYICAVCEKWIQPCERNTYKCSGCQIPFCSKTCQREADRLGHQEFCAQATDSLNDRYMWEHVHCHEVYYKTSRINKARAQKENVIVGRGLCMTEDVKRHDVIAKVEGDYNPISFRFVDIKQVIDYDKLDSELDYLSSVPNKRGNYTRVPPDETLNPHDGMFANSPMPLIPLLDALKKGTCWSVFSLMFSEMSKANAFFAIKNDEIYVVAREDILKGEFVSVAYGINFWMTNIAFGRYYNTRFSGAVWRIQEWFMKYERSWPPFLGKDCMYYHEGSDGLIQHCESNADQQCAVENCFKTLRHRIRYVGEDHSNIQAQVDRFVFSQLLHILGKKAFRPILKQMKKLRYMDHFKEKNFVLS